VVLSGCVSNEVRITESQRGVIQSAEKINVIYHGPIGPALQTAGDAIKFHVSFAIAGWGTPGLQLMGENDIQDPLISIQDKLINQLTEQGQIQNLVTGKSPVPWDKTKVEDIRNQFGDGLYLQLIPGQWTIIYYVADWSRYHMYYGVRAQLIDTNNDQVLWSSYCQANQDDGKNAPNMEELMANKAERIKVWMEDATDQCAQQLTDKFLVHI